MNPFEVLRMRPTAVQPGNGVLLAATPAGGTQAGNQAVTFTVPAGALIVVHTAFTSGVTDHTSMTVTDNQGGTYTQIVQCKRATSTAVHACWIRDSAPPAGSLTVTGNVGTVTTTGGAIEAWAITNRGDTEATKFGGAAGANYGFQSDQASGTTPNPSFISGAPSTNSIILGSIHCNSNASTMTQKAGWTEAGEVTYNTPATGAEFCHKNKGETSSSILWGASVSSAYTSIVIEIKT